MDVYTLTLIFEYACIVYGWLVGSIDDYGWMDGRKDRLMDEWMCTYLLEYLNIHIYVIMHGWMDGWMEGAKCFI